MPPFDIVLMGWCWSAKSKITPPDDMKSIPELSLGKGTHLGGGVRFAGENDFGGLISGEQDSMWVCLKIG